MTAPETGLSPVSPGAPTRRPLRRRLIIGAAAVALVCFVTAVVLWRQRAVDGQGLAAEAAVTVSSTQPGSAARDLVTSGRSDQPGAAWQSERQTLGAWVELAWPRAVKIHEVVIVGSPVGEPGLSAGFLHFGDGSFVQFQMDAQSRATTIPVTGRVVDRLRITASAVRGAAENVTIAEVVVNSARADDVVSDTSAGGNVARKAAIRDGDAAGASDANAMHDGSGASGAEGVGADWTVAQPVGSWLELAWSRPRELTSIEVVGSAASSASLAAATLTFSDGATIPLGAVLPDPGRPTTVSFMPRVTRSVRLTIDRTGGSGALVLSELRAYQRGSTPLRGASTGPATPEPVVGRCDDPGSAAITVQVRCPVSGSTVDGTVALTVAMPAGYHSVTATVWPNDGSPPGPRVQGASDASGMATLGVDVSRAPAGPLTVEVVADGPARRAQTIHFQLFREGPSPGDVPSSAAAAGRTLAYAEEFNTPVSLSRTGAGADYAAAKPVHDGAQDFGDAIFPDPGRGLDNVRVVGDRFLRIDVGPLPPGYTDPQGWGRSHVGGLLASARVGGSGFSAQYGYFEARMFVPKTAGTWPAFWLLPADNLVEPTPVVAEIDAVELYGHDPRGACHSSHSYRDGQDGGVARCGTRFSSNAAAAAWHTYGVSVTPSSLDYYIDGRQVASAPQVDGGQAPFFFLVDLALGGGWPVQLGPVQERASLYVDYVRVYV